MGIASSRGVRMCGYSLKQGGAYVWVFPLAGGCVCVGIASSRGCVCVGVAPCWWVRMCGYSLKQVGAYVWVLPLAGGCVCVGIASSRWVCMCGW